MELGLDSGQLCTLGPGPLKQAVCLLVYGLKGDCQTKEPYKGPIHPMVASAVVPLLTGQNYKLYSWPDNRCPYSNSSQWQEIFTNLYHLKLTFKRILLITLSMARVCNHYMTWLFKVKQKLGTVCTSVTPLESIANHTVLISVFAPADLFWPKQFCMRVHARVLSKLFPHTHSGSLSLWPCHPSTWPLCSPRATRH